MTVGFKRKFDFSCGIAVCWNIIRANEKGAELFRYFSNRGKECQVICTAQESLADVKAFLPNEIWFIAKRNDETILNNSVRY